MQVYGGDHSKWFPATEIKTRYIDSPENQDFLVKQANENAVDTTNLSLRAIR